MAEDKQLIDEWTMEQMSVAPPAREAQARAEKSDAETLESGSGDSLVQQMNLKPGEHNLDQDVVLDAPTQSGSGVADEDPLSAHPS